MDIETMKYYYQNNLWTLERVRKLLDAGKITRVEYQEILASKE